ncbi:uncharacterized protein LOC131221710 [Magnolia sinica]|uniref:uncharacterized protein LOC131221710 n=1 Tax=Magnolia sinica TaxID=86752 RepID=UPI0026594A82|nr:uncharacterized protein LOC131221710 [Magnolia sinica]
MGGGAVIRTARVSGFSAVTGFRNILPTPSRADQIARRTLRPVPAVASAPANDAHVNSRNVPIDPVLVQKPSWEIDEWEFAEYLDSADHPPRVVFGAVPTIEEAREATSDLKDALENIYLSSSTVGNCDKSPRVVQGSTLQEPPSLEHLEIKACVTSESEAILKSVPKPVINALHLLNESPEAQNVVASIVADKNVWDAVMKNDKVMEFYHSQQRSCDLSLNTYTATQEGFTGHGSAEQLPGSFGDWFAQFVDNVKLKVAKMVSNLSEFFQNVMGSSAEENSSGDNKRGDTNCTTMVSFMALGILGIIVVLLKRK